MNIKVGDNVLVIAGKDKGKSGKVIGTLRNKHQVVVEGINVHKRHQKPSNKNEKGGIIEFNAPIDVSNVKKVDKATKEVKKETKKVEKVEKAPAKKAPAKKTTKTTEKKAK